MFSRGPVPNYNEIAKQLGEENEDTKPPLLPRLSYRVLRHVLEILLLVVAYRHHTHWSVLWLFVIAFVVIESLANALWQLTLEVRGHK